MEKYNKMQFEIMIEEWMADHKDEMSNLKIGDVYFNEELGYVADAEDEKCIYALTDDGTGNIRIDYIGEK